MTHDFLVGFALGAVAIVVIEVLIVAGGFMIDTIKRFLAIVGFLTVTASASVWVGLSAFNGG